MSSCVCLVKCRPRSTLELKALNLDALGGLLIKLVFERSLVPIIRFKLILECHDLLIALIEPLS